MNKVLDNPLLAFGIVLNQPLLTLLGLERFPKQRGAASSMQAFLSLLVNATVSGVISPAVSQTPLTLSVAAQAIGAAGFLFWVAAGGRGKEPFTKSPAKRQLSPSKPDWQGQGANMLKSQKRNIMNYALRPSCI